jgi:YD repeat-containing protein
MLEGSEDAAGSSRGPVWGGSVAELSGTLELRFDVTIDNLTARCRWPERVALVPTGEVDVAPGFFLAPESSAAEAADLEAIVRCGTSDDNCECNQTSTGTTPPTITFCYSKGSSTTCGGSAPATVPQETSESGCKNKTCPAGSYSVSVGPNTPNLGEAGDNNSGGCGCSGTFDAAVGEGGNTGSGSANSITNLTAPGPAEITLSSGNLSLALSNIGGGSFDPVSAFSYNSQASAPSSNGYGITGKYSRNITVVDPTSVVVLTAAGSRKLYTNKNTTKGPGYGQYLSPAGTPESLIQNGDGTWTLTQPDKFQLNFDGTGQLASLKSPAGSRWTLTNSGGRVTKIADPTGRRTTFVYDGSNNLQRVVDPAGRITTFVVDGNGNLTKKICPELCTTGSCGMMAGTGSSAISIRKGRAPATPMTPAAG